MTFCDDTDILDWEPDIFRDAAFASQLQCSGQGDLDGTAFTASGVSFAAAGVAPRQVLTLSGAVSGCYPIVSVDGPDRLTVSIMHPALDSSPPRALPVGSASGLTFAVRNFYPQRRIASELLRGLAGAGHDAPPTILNPAVLRRPCLLATLHMIYNALAAAAAEPMSLRLRADLYERLFRRSLAQVRVHLDADGDGRPDTVRCLATVRFHRS